MMKSNMNNEFYIGLLTGGICTFGSFNINKNGNQIQTLQSRTFNRGSGTFPSFEVDNLRI